VNFDLNKVQEGKVLGMAWVDNFVLAAKTKDELQENFQLFLRNCKRVRVTLDTTEPCFMVKGTVLGLEVDLEEKKIRMDPKWIRKLEEKTMKTWMTPRELYEITGSCVWAYYTQRTPLCWQAENMETIRRTANLVGEGMSWDTVMKFSATELNFLSLWVQEVLRNAWTSPCKISTSHFHVWSDASSSMWAFLKDDFSITGQGDFDSSQKSWHIFIKEAYAANKSVHATKGTPRTLHIDNMPLVLAIKRMVSSNKITNEWLRTWDWENISVVWVSTTEQKADAFTRGARFSQAPEGPTQVENTQCFL
jgi:hypothetical protein